MKGLQIRFMLIVIEMLAVNIDFSHNQKFELRINTLLMDLNNSPYNEG